MDSLRRLAAELSAADPHWNVEPLLRAADALEWIATRPTSPNDPGPHSDWWDLYRAARWALGYIPDHPASRHGNDPTHCGKMSGSMSGSGG